MGREDGGARPPGDEHERMQREAEHRAGETPGGLTSDDLGRLGHAEWQRDRRAADERAEDRAEARRREQQQRLDEHPPGESILDEVDPDNTAAMRSQGLGPDEPPQLTGGLLDALKKPENLIRLAGVGLGLIGLLLLMAGLRAEAQVRDSAVASATPTAAASAGAVGTPATQATPPLPTTARPATPLSAGPVVATQLGTVTSYVVEDLKGDGLRYDWRHSATCASHSGEATATYSWDHPHPPCPDEPFHPSFVTVQVTDGSGQALVRQYTLGSRPGRGQVPAGGGVFAAQSPNPTTAALSPTPQPTTAAGPATGTPGPTASPATAGGGGPNLPLVLLGGLLTFGGLALVVRGPLIFGGPRIRKEEPKGPCEKEKQAEAEARARREAARTRLERINELRASNDRARADLERAQREEAASKDDRNVSWGEDADIGPSSRVYTNKDQKARIDRAEAAARAARQAADAASAAFQGAGNGGEATAAQQGFEDANRQWERADAALKRCLELNAPPPPPTPPAPPVQPTPPTTTPPPTGGPVTAGPGGGPTIATPPPSGPTQVRECDPPGVERARPGAPATTESVWVPNLRGAKLKFDSDLRAITDFPIDDFLDWAQFTKESFFAGKKIVSLSEGLGPDGGFPVGGALDLVDFPDFLTYYDKMIDMALKALKKAADQQALIARNGEYWLEYSSERFELRCEPWQRCVNGRWVNFGKSSFVSTGETRDGQTTDKRQVTADPSAIQGAVQDAINRCFRQIEAAKTRAEHQARQFAERCR